MSNKEKRTEFVNKILILNNELSVLIDSKEKVDGINLIIDFFNLQKSYMKDKLGIDYGTYRLSDLKTGTIIYAKETGYGYTIKEIENYLNKDNKND